MAALVADYNNSSSENDSDDDNTKCRDERKEDEPAAAVDYFQIANNNTSDDEKCEDQPVVEVTKLAESDASTKLPNPLANGLIQLPSFSAATNDCNTSSVFVTAFQRAEDAKQSILERHVKMTTVKETESDEPKWKHRKKDICLNFLKGKCRYGQKCRYNHNLESPVPSSDTDLPVHAREYSYHEQVVEETVDDDEDGYGLKEKRKKRVGITNSLVPPKRAMQSLSKQREQERPWTMKR